MDADKIYDFNTRYVSSTPIRIHVDNVVEKGHQVADCLCDAVEFCQFQLVGDCRYHSVHGGERCEKLIKPNILKKTADPQNDLSKCPEDKWELNNCTRNECDDTCNKSTT